MRPIQIEQVAVSALKPNPANTRTHSKKQLHQIAASIKEFGFNSVLVIDEDNVILVGNGRFEAAKLLGLSTVPAIRVTDLNELQKAAFATGDNRIGENGGWDPEKLAALFRQLDTRHLSFDPEITGYGTAEIDVLIDGSGAKAKPDRADAIPVLEQTAVSKRGDLWCLGEHRLLCGDALDPDAYRELLGDQRARLVFTDPPYNVPIDGHVGGLGAVKHREFAMASGEMSEAEFRGFLGQIFKNMADVSEDGAVHFVFMDWRHIGELLAAARPVYSELKNVCVWNKDNGGMGSFYRSKHELVFVYKVGTAPHVNTVELGRSGRYRTNVWDYAGVNTFRAGRGGDLDMHPTVKPVALVIDAIKDCSRRGDIVLDPFSGSGTTIMAAQKSGRRGFAIEIDPLYVDVAVRRWQAFTGQEPSLEVFGTTFDEMANPR
jgi:DNA modification methylase